MSETPPNAKPWRMERTVWMVNPASGGGRGLRRWQRLRAAMPEVVGGHVVQGTSADDAAAQLRSRVAEGHVDRVIAVGGDGTAHLVANTLLNLSDPSPVPMGIVPVGTGSDLARHLPQPRRPLEALRHVLGATPRPFDAMALRTDDGRRRYSINIASGGLSGAVVQALGATPNRGQLSYLTATLAALLKYQPFGCRVRVDGVEVYDGALFLVAVANGEFFGKGMRVAPTSQTDDGRLEVVIVPPVARWQFPWRLPQFLSGAHLKWPGVVHRSALHVRIEPSPDFPPYELDGEYFAVAGVDVQVRPGALRMLV